MSDLIQTKTAPPSWMGDKIRRDALLKRLDGALGKRLTIVHAPAGYGKTSLLLQWRQQHGGDALRIAWLTLEKEDSDLKRLTEYVSLALDGPRGGEGEGSAAIPADLPPRAALSAIINRLMREQRPVVLIFDDFHRAESAAVVDFVKAMVRLAPENCHFLVASRDYPALDQSILAAEDQLLEIRAEDLRFSVAETEALLQRDGVAALDGGDVRRIFERTEGWPIALQLTALSLRRSADRAQLVERLGGSSAELASYLSEQVLTGLPAETQELVIRTALVDTLTGDVVDALCDRQDGWLVLERLEQQGVLLTPLSEDRRAYRYHQLFAENMRERLARRDIAKFRALQCVAARWFAGHGNVAQAVDHAIQARNDDLLVAIIEGAGAWRLIPNGFQDVAARALDALTDDVVRARPLLTLMRIYLAIKRGEMGEARADHDRLVASAGDDQVSADRWTEIQIVGDILAEYENVPVTFEDLLAREALLRTLPTNDHLMLGHVCESLSAKYYETGRLERAIEPLLAAREHYMARGSLYSDLFTRFMEARIRQEQGRLKEAIDILTTARTGIEDRFGARSDLAANCAAFEAAMLCDQDRLAEASLLIDWPLSHMEQSDGWVDVYAAAYFTAARVVVSSGRIEEARSILGRAGRLARRRRLRQLELLAELFELQLLIEHGQLDDLAAVCAVRLGLDVLADDMALESPVFRKVVLAAALCRSKLRLIAGEHETALAELEALKRWGSQRGAGRLLIDVNLLIAGALSQAGESGRAQLYFDDAVGTAMFQGIVRPFMDARRFIEPLVKATLQGAQRVDRFRDQFLKDLSRAYVGQSAQGGAQGPFSAAEISVLTYLCQGYANKEIARLIGMSPDTVKYRLKSLFRKLGVEKRRDAVVAARDRGLVSSDDIPPLPETA